MANAIQKASISFLDSESKDILNKIYEKMADLDQKLSFVAEFLVYRFPGSNGFQSFLNGIEPPTPSFANLHQQQSQQQPSFQSSMDEPTMEIRERGKRVFVSSNSSSAAASPVVSTNSVGRQSPSHQMRPRQSAAKRKQPTEAIIRICQPPTETYPPPLLQQQQRQQMLDGVKMELANSQQQQSSLMEESSSAALGAGCLLIAEDKEALPLADDNQHFQQEDGQMIMETGPPTVEFPTGALQRAADKAAKSFEGTQPKVFAWQMLRETVSDEELKEVHITLRTYSGETADDLLGRQLPKIQSIVLATIRQFGWDVALSQEARLARCKTVLAHLKNNTKVRNWTLREGRPNRSPNNPEVLWKRYAAYLGPGGLAKAGLPLPNQLPKISRRSPNQQSDGNEADDSPLALPPPHADALCE